MKNYIIISLMLGIMPSCGKRHKIQDNSSPKSHGSSKINSFHEEAFRLQAKLIDIPLPLITEYIPLYCTEGDALSLGCMTDLSAHQIEQFYLQEMEKAGWQIVAHGGGYEQLLIFEKPDRICSISIRPHTFASKKADMIIFVTPRQSVY